MADEVAQDKPEDTTRNRLYAYGGALFYQAARAGLFSCTDYENSQYQEKFILRSMKELKHSVKCLEELKYRGMYENFCERREDVEVDPCLLEGEMLKVSE